MIVKCFDYDVVFLIVNIMDLTDNEIDYFSHSLGGCEIEWEDVETENTEDAENTEDTENTEDIFGGDIYESSVITVI